MDENMGLTKATGRLTYGRVKKNCGKGGGKKDHIHLEL